MSFHNLSLGIQVPEVERKVQWDEYLAMARFADRSIFDSIWVGDHLLYRGDGRPERGPHEAWTLLAGLGAVTERVTIGPLVACAGFHPPAIIAKMAATIAEITHGRFVLGLGAGWNQPEFTAFDIPFDRRASRFAEALAIITSLIEGRRCTLSGDFHTVDDAVLLPEPRFPIPIMIGSNGDKVLRTSLPTAQIWNTWYDWFGNTAEGFARLNSHVSTLVSEGGGDPHKVRRSACLLVRVDPSSSERPDPTGAQAISLADLPHHLDEFRAVGADEVILVADPINESSMRAIDAVLSS